MADQNDKNLTPAGLVALIILVGLLIAAVIYAVHVWQAMAGVRMSAFGWTFMILGVAVTFALGAGLMGLVFYSSRHDLDR